MVGTKGEIMAENQLVLGPVRLSFVNVFEKVESPSGVMQFGLTAMVPKADKALVKRMNDAIKAGIAAGIRSNKITKNDIKNLKLPIHDGDDKESRGNRGSEFDKMWYFSSTNARNQPGVVDRDKQPIVDDDEVYSGIWAYLHVTFHAFNRRGTRGIRCNLNHLMKFKDDDRLDGRKSVDEAFEDLEPPDEDME